MQIDALTLAAVADELTSHLLGARVEEIYQPTPHALALHCYGNGRKVWLLASAHPQLARVHLLTEKPRKLTSEPPVFVMLLRKHIEGARIVAIRQPRWERLIEIGFARGPQAAEPTATTWLVAELMGRMSNLVAYDADGTILGALRLIGSEINRYRTIAPHIVYRYPPPQTRLIGGEPHPRLRGEVVAGEQLAQAAAESLASQALAATTAIAGTTVGTPPASGPAARGRRRQHDQPTLTGLLTGQIEGFSREVAHEVAARALGVPDVPLEAGLLWEAIAREARLLAALPGSHDWQPTLVYAPGNESAPIAFAVYHPRQYAEATLRPAESVSAMLAAYAAGGEWQGEVEAAKGDLRHLLHTLRERSLRKDEALRGELATEDEARRLRAEADALLAFQGEIAPGETTFTTENVFTAEGAEADEGGEPASLTITLDPRLSAVENANARYARYHKLHRAWALLPGQIEANALELARIEQVLTDLALAETTAEIAHVRAEVIEAGYLKGAAAKAAAAKAGKKANRPQGGKGTKGGKGNQQARRAPDGGTPLRRQSSDGITLLVGKNSRQNEEVTFGQASPNDLWLHARGVPGAHVIVKSGGRPIPETTLHEAAALAAYYSQARTAGSVPVDYTEQRYVRHLKGGGPGMVNYEREHTLHAAPENVGV